MAEFFKHIVLGWIPSEGPLKRPLQAKHLLESVAETQLYKEAREQGWEEGEQTLSAMATSTSIVCPPLLFD